MREENKSHRKKYVNIFIITLIIIQGIYVFFPLPELWPISSYAMYSRSIVKTVTSRIDIKGVREDSSEFSLIIPKHTNPLERVKLKAIVQKIMESENNKIWRTKNINKAIEILDFLPIKKERLRELIGTNIFYSEGFEEKEKAFDELSMLLLAQYKYNSDKSLWRDKNSEIFNELRFYIVYWDWTDTDLDKVSPEEKLLYSTKSGLVKYE